MGIAIKIGGLAIGSNTQSWSSLYYILKSGDTWYRRETNTAGGYFKLWYSSDAGENYESLMTLALTEDRVIIDSSHQYVHSIVGTSYHVSTTGGELLYNT